MNMIHNGSFESGYPQIIAVIHRDIDTPRGYM